MSDRPTIISKDALLPLGLVATMLAAAVSFGVMYEKVTVLQKNGDERTSEIAAMRNDVSQIKIDVAVIRSKILTNGLSNK